MTVAELRAILAEHPDDMRVCAAHPDSGWACDISGAEQSTEAIPRQVTPPFLMLKTWQ
jgi:hypothetical protein